MRIEHIGDATLYLGDCRERMAALPADSVDAIVTDPPYGLGFMGKGWDHGIPGVEFWTEASRVAKPGAHLLAFGGTRTFHRLACAIEDAGWEIRDCVMWVYGSGFPKSLDVSKAIDKTAGAERARVLVPTRNGNAATRSTSATDMHSGFTDVSTPATDAARQWQGWGTALKPAWEPIIVARKPLAGTVAENVLAHGMGAMNVDACRIAHDEECRPMAAQAKGNLVYGQAGRREQTTDLKPLGRWPANLIHDGSDEVVALFPSEAGGGFGVRGSRSDGNGYGFGGTFETVGHGDTGSAARFFYCAKASKDDREGLLDDSTPAFFAPPMGNGIGGKEHDPLTATPKRNTHPTVKPTALMRYLCRLVTPPRGIVLDPFAGSGSTGVAAAAEGFRFIAFELEPDYFDIACERIGNAYRQQRMFA